MIHEEAIVSGMEVANEIFWSLVVKKRTKS